MAFIFREKENWIGLGLPDRNNIEHNKYFIFSEDIVVLQNLFENNFEISVDGQFENIVFSISWDKINTSGSNLLDLDTRNHDDLQNIYGNGSVHLSIVEKAGYDDVIDKSHFQNSDIGTFFHNFTLNLNTTSNFNASYEVYRGAENNPAILEWRELQQKWYAGIQGDTKEILLMSDTLSFFGAPPVSQQVFVMGNIDNDIGGLTISDPPTQTEVALLRDKCEELADDLRAIYLTLQSYGLLV